MLKNMKTEQELNNDNLIYTVVRIEEPDYGCEEREDNQPYIDTVYLKNECGNEVGLKVDDTFLINENIEEGTRVLYKDGEGITKVSDSELTPLNTADISEMKPEEYHLLKDFLYEAIFIPEGVAAPPRNIIEQAELQVYIEGFGSQKDDIAYMAFVSGRAAGAVWVRDMKDYGHVEDGVPSFAISLYKEYRGLGIGTQLMKTMLAELRRRGHKKASLSVQKENYAVNMYLKTGFKIIDVTDEEYVMVCELG